MLLLFLHLLTASILRLYSSGTGWSGVERMKGPSHYIQLLSVCITRAALRALFLNKKSTIMEIKSKIAVGDDELADATFFCLNVTYIIIIAISLLKALPGKSVEGTFHMLPSLLLCRQLCIHILGPYNLSTPYSMTDSSMNIH